MIAIGVCMQTEDQVRQCGVSLADKTPEEAAERHAFGADRARAGQARSKAHPHIRVKALPRIGRKRS